MSEQSEHGHYTIDLGPNIRVVVPSGGDRAKDSQAIFDHVASVIDFLKWGQGDEPAAEVVAAVRLLFPPRVGTVAAQQPQNNAGGQRRGQGRTDRFAAAPNEQCDLCNGPCGVKPRTGAQTSDSIVCLGKCTDPNQNGQDYVHRVRWADSQPAQQTSVPLPQGMPDGPDLDPEDLPF